jgi:iron(III) transport system ATP-binding protein
MADLRLEGLSRVFGTQTALEAMDLYVEDGSFVSLLGPSGCGKSTTLGLVAGLDRPTTGRITVGGQTMADAASGLFIQPEERGVGLVLQSYALWPHMTVRQNVRLPLEIRRMSRAQREQRVDEYLALVEMEPYGDRYPHELSGGQQQRVALARTLVYEPVLLLLDEPLSNVDAKLRERARGWLRQLQRKFAITTVFVTHDQSEALTMSDRIAVMSQGKLVQYGAPAEVYARPNSPFVADFVGSSNFLRGRLSRRLDGGVGEIDIDGMPVRARVDSAIALDSPVVLSVRPEHITVADGAVGPDSNLLRATVSYFDFLGPRCLYHAKAAAQTIRFESPHASLCGELAVSFPVEQSFVFAAE